MSRSLSTGAAVPVALVLSAAAVAGLLPLHEMDLAQHLANGEWMVRNRAVPFIEPFAWTREGQPYFAYSWLLQITYFLLLDRFGPVALHLLNALIAGAAVWAAWWAALQLRAQRPAAAAVALIHLALLWGVAGTLRPQQVLFIAIPLAWGVAARIRHSGLTVPRLAALAAVGALAANSHIFFPLTAAPIAFLFLAAGPFRTWALAGVALVAGWLLTPYVLVWHQVFALNFGDNVLLRRPPTIAEFAAGVEYAARRPGVIIAVTALLAAPWLAPEGETARARLVRAVAWTAGLLLFAWAGRLVLVWWAACFGMVVALAATVRVTALLPNPRTRAAALGGAAAIVVLAAAPPIAPVFWLFEGDTRQRMLPRAGEDPALWLPAWLLCSTQAGAHGRIYTEFNYGSELTWMLPGYSVSIDGRTIFPDSIARDFAYAMYGRRRVFSNTWRGADLALVDRTFWLAPVLDGDTSWVLLAQARPTSRGSAGALWARREWWQRWGSGAVIPAADVRPGDHRALCAAPPSLTRGMELLPSPD
jgi:hypothetical protein